MFPFIIFFLNTFMNFRIFPKLFNYHETVGIQHDVLELIRENVEEHEQTIDHNEPRDFTDKVKLLTLDSRG